MKKLPTFVRVIASGALVLLAANCGTTGGASIGGAPSALTADPHTEGRRLYMTRCTSCHAAEPIGDYSSSEWRELLPEMAAESKLTPAQEKAVLEYVLGSL